MRSWDCAPRRLPSWAQDSQQPLFVCTWLASFGIGILPSELPRPLSRSVRTLREESSRIRRFRNATSFLRRFVWMASWPCSGTASRHDFGSERSRSTWKDLRDDETKLEKVPRLGSRRSVTSSNACRFVPAHPPRLRNGVGSSSRMTANLLVQTKDLDPKRETVRCASSKITWK